MAVHINQSLQEGLINDGSDNSAILPQTDTSNNPITYSKFDVNDKIVGMGRDGEPMVIGSNGSIYYIDDLILALLK